MDLPFYKIVVNENDDTGVDFNAFVDAPAHMKGFIAFGKDAVRYSFNDEKRIVTGVMISTGTPIYRKDDQIGEHYVVFDAPTVDTIRKKFFKNGFNKNVNADHDPNKVIQGVSLIDSYIVSNSDPKLPSVPEAFTKMKLQDGSWIASYYVSDDKIWQGVKDGTFNGFSVEGWFDKVQINVKKDSDKMRIEKFDSRVSQVSKYHIDVDEVEIKLGAQLNYIDVNGDKVPIVSGEYITQSNEKILVDANGTIRNIGFAKTNKSTMTEKKDKLWDTLKAIFNSEEAKPEPNKFAEATTADGIVVMYDGELTDGTQVFIMSEGEQLPAPEGDHQLTLEDGTVKLVSLDGSGVIVSIEDFNEEPTENTEAVAELKQEVQEALSEFAKELRKETDEKIDKLTKENEAFKAELKTIKAGEKFKSTPKSGAIEKEPAKKLTASELLKGSKTK